MPDQEREKDRRRRAERAVDEAARRGPSIPAESREEESMASEEPPDAEEQATNDPVEEASRESFPASDPPGWAGTPPKK